MVNAVDFSSGFFIEAGAASPADTAPAAGESGGGAGGLFASLVARAIADAGETTEPSAAETSDADVAAGMDQSMWLGLFAQAAVTPLAPAEDAPRGDVADDSLDAIAATPDAAAESDTGAATLVVTSPVMPIVASDPQPIVESGVTALPGAIQAAPEARPVSGGAAPVAHARPRSPIATGPTSDRTEAVVPDLDDASGAQVAEAMATHAEGPEGQDVARDVITVPRDVVNVPRDVAAVARPVVAAADQRTSNVVPPAPREGARQDASPVVRPSHPDGEAAVEGPVLAAALVELAAGEQLSQPARSEADTARATTTTTTSARGPQAAQARAISVAQPDAVPQTEEAAEGGGSPMTASPAATGTVLGRAGAGAGAAPAGGEAAEAPAVTGSTPPPVSPALPLRLLEVDTTGARPAEVALAYSPATAADRENIATIVRSMHVQWTGEGGAEARLRLQPEHLGHVSMTIRVERGEVRAHVVTETAEAGHWIEGHQEELRSSLREQGLEVKEFVVTTNPDDRRERHAQPEAQRRRARARRAEARQSESPRFEIVV